MPSQVQTPCSTTFRFRASSSQSSSLSAGYRLLSPTTMNGTNGAYLKTCLAMEIRDNDSEAFVHSVNVS
jgi:hypothetical protein